ncbi:MAG: hypothetical protein FGM32_10535 [Candidatus Kapabacteria bacterium]|nr:hypothetical protein [Candidatus Kapabacteria bacterium]
MHNVVNIAERHSVGRIIPTKVFVADVARRASALYFSKELGFELQDSLPPIMRVLSKGMQHPVAVITGTDNRHLVIDALTQKKPEFLDSLILEFLKNSDTQNTESYITRSPMNCLDTMEIYQVQALSDSLLLCLDGMRGEAGIADITTDSMVHLARLPKNVKEQFRDSRNSAAWDQYVQMGVKMTQVQLAYAPNETNSDLIVALTQMYFKSDEERRRDTGMAKQMDLRGRMARWKSRPSHHQGSRPAQLDTAHGATISLTGIAPQRIHGVSVMSGGTKDFYSSNQDSQFVVTYADKSGEHLLIPRSKIYKSDSAFNFRGYTLVSALLDGRILLSHPRNSIFGTYDTVNRVFNAMRPVGPLALLCNASTFEKRISGFLAPDLLVDTAGKRFVVVSWAVSDPTSKYAPLGLIINVYDAITGGHLYSKAFYTNADAGIVRFKPFNVLNNVLYAISQGDKSTSLVKIRL